MNDSIESRLDSIDSNPEHFHVRTLAVPIRSIINGSETIRRAAPSVEPMKRLALLLFCGAVAKTNRRRSGGAVGATSAGVMSRDAGNQIAGDSW
ncbi:hypothetical protein [Sphingomonas sp. 28-62-11]|uniref:hypothetical protein n=1 Tax=Sphingomonas sp. 28-62-11 TaxID=1970432 RepID=UPI000BD01E86|nr:MAG: hypothetical protein B7Y49_04945 [Sphingomonas sp. 28-62-11]